MVIFSLNISCFTYFNLKKYNNEEIIFENYTKTVDYIKPNDLYYVPTDEEYIQYEYVEWKNVK